MKKIVILYALVCLTSCGNSGQNEAYNACAALIRAKLGGNVSFDPSTEYNNSSGDDFYYAWPAGSITGGSRDKPDLMTGSMLPTASCMGYFSKREITYLTVNGEDLLSQPQNY